MNAPLRERLVAMIAEDERVRAELAADGSLFQGYHPRMAEVHHHNATELATIIAAHGWPGYRRRRRSAGRVAHRSARDWRPRAPAGRRAAPASRG
jgi:hypothetical protein